jgi:hypothetical protein
MLAITVTPAEVWRAPVNDAVYTGFDPNLIFTAPGGPGEVRVTRDLIDLTASPTSRPSANLTTTLRRTLSAAVDVTVMEATAAAEPLRVGWWSPWTETGYFVTFGPAPLNLVSARSLTGGTSGPTLVGGDVSASTDLGRYRLGSSYHIAFVVDRAARVIRAAVSGDGLDATAVLDAHRFPALFDNVQISLSASAVAGQGTSHVALRNYRLALPHERQWAAKVDDPRVTALVIALVSLGVVGIALAVISAWRPRPIPVKFRASWWVIGASAVYLAGNALLFPLGGHPFDFGYERLYAYVGRVYGAVNLYYLPSTVSLAAIWNGTPLIESEFPYNTFVAYMFTGIGWVNSLLFAGGGSFSPDSPPLGYLIKTANVLFGLGDAALIYWIMRELQVTERRSRIAAALFLFNPAVWFSMSVWGQTHVISIFFVLAAILLAQKHLPLWAWLALSAAILTRPQMVVFGLLLGIVFLRKFSWRENLSALSWTVIVNFVAWAPLTLATSPSLPIDIMLNNFRVQEAGGNQISLTTVSQDAYSVWPLVTYLFHGAAGLQRAFTPSSELVAGPLTYQRLSQILTVAAMLVVSAALVMRKRAALEAGEYLPLLAVGVTALLMLLTGVLATHFLLALPFLLLCRRWMGSVAYYYIVAIWSITTLVPMYGDMGIVMSSQDYPVLARAHNHITQFFVDLYASNRFITVAVIANICAVIWLAWLAFRPAPLAREAC